MPKITAIQRQLQKMQTYHLRKPFKVDRAALVYGSYRDEFRLVFVPIQDHQYYAKHIKFFPSSLRGTPRPTEYCVIEKATYDDNQDEWVIRSDAKINSRHSASPQRRPSVAHSPIRQPSRSNWGPPPQASDRAARCETSTGSEWFDQKNPTFGFSNNPTPGAASRHPSASSQQNSNWNANRSYRTATATPPSWLPTGVSSSSPVQSNNMPQGQVRRVSQPEWGAPTFNATGAGDFPSLPAGGRVPPKRTGMPSLPPPRSVPASNAEYSRPPTIPSQAPQPSASRDIIFGDQDWDYLEDRASQSSGQRSREMENNGLDVPRLRDPNSEFADAQRTLRRLPNQQATPGGSSQFDRSGRFVDTMRVYNMRRLAETIRSGLTELQGRRKEIRLFGRLGNVVYPTHPEMLTRPWEFTDIDSVLVKKHSVRPWFSPM